MNLEFAEYLSDDELSKIAPMLERLTMLEKQKTSQDLYMDLSNVYGLVLLRVDITKYTRINYNR